MEQTYAFYVKGMHCNSCVILTQSELQDVPGVTSAKATLLQNRIEVTGMFGEKTEEEVMNELSAVLQPHGYSLSLKKEAEGTNAKWSRFIYAVPIALLFVTGFLFLQKLGIVNLVNTSEVSYGAAFLIGLIASVSTCMAVVGGIVLSLSASFAKEGNRVQPQVLFHVGRLVSFFILGGTIGALGSVFQFGATGMLVLGIVVALVLLILGINLLDIFPWANKLQLAIPSALGSRAHGLKNVNHVLTPLLVGIATFFLPCGFTQSMQIYTLTTGSFLRGGLTMFAFALGTVPVLSLLSFGSLGIRKKAQSDVFFKVAGLIVIFFAIFNLINTLVGAGIMDPIFSF